MNPSNTDTRWRWMVLTLVAAILLYPVVARVARRPGGRTGDPPPPAVHAAIQSSFRAFSAGQYQEAIAYGNAALRIDPASADAYNNIAAAYAGLGNWDLAIQNIRQALRINPEYQLAKNNLAWYLREKAGGAPAPPKADPAADSRLNISFQLYRAGKYRECINVAKDALRLAPHSAVAYNNIAACSSAMGMWDDAIAAARQALGIDPTFALAKNNLAWALDRKSGKK